MSSQYKTTTSAYQQKYEGGYGLEYPDGHIIRIHKQILEYECGIKGGKILDYGCGVGQHLQYFKNQGFVPYGCDIIPAAIEKAKSKMPEYANNFFAIPNIPNLKEYFKEKFNVIYSNQVLYYLKDDDIQNLVRQFYDMLLPDGIFFATMITPTSYYFKHVESKEGELSKVVLKGRLNEVTYINFKTREDLENLFKPFKKLHIGSYGSTIREDEGPAEHLIFVGKK